MNILLITTLYPGYKGQSRMEVSYALHQFAKEWVEKGHNVRVVRVWSKFPSIFNLSQRGKATTKYKKDDIVNIDGVDVNIVTVQRFPKIDYLSVDKNRIFKKVSKLTINYQPDIVLCHMMNPSLYISKKLKDKWNVPLILTMHHTDLKQLNNLNRRLKEYRRLEPYIDKIGFRSIALMKKYNNLSLPQKSKFVMNSGIEKEVLITCDKLEAKKKAKTKEIFVVAKMTQQKNVDVIIKAFEEIALKNNLQLKIAGNGPQEKNILKMINSSVVKNRIQYLGLITREKVLQYMEKSDVFVLVSSPETFGLVYLEAMAKGCITIGSKGEGIDGVIEDGLNGYLSEPGNIKELTKKMNHSISLDINSKSKLIENAVDTATKMTQDKMAMDYLDVLKETIDNF